MEKNIAERDLELFTALMAVMEEPNQTQAALLLLIHALYRVNGYVTFSQVCNIVPQPVLSLKIMIGRIKGRKKLVMNEEGYIKLTEKGYADVSRLLGRRSAYYDKVKQTIK